MAAEHDCPQSRPEGSVCFEELLRKVCKLTGRRRQLSGRCQPRPLLDLRQAANHTFQRKHEDFPVPKRVMNAQHRLALSSPSLIALRFFNSVILVEGMAALIYGLIFSGGLFQSVEIARTDEFARCDGWTIRYYVGLGADHKDYQYDGDVPSVTVYVSLLQTRVDLP